MWELDSLEFIHINALQPTTINHASSSKLSIQDKKICCLKDIQITCTKIYLTHSTKIAHY